MSADARKHIRQCWGCDCDGESHKSGRRVVGVQKYIVDQMAGAIEKLTGYRPPTCPWRAMSDPLVGPVIRAAQLGRSGLGHLAQAEPALFVDALAVYLTARDTVRNHDDAAEAKERLAKIKADAAKTKGGRR